MSFDALKPSDPSPAITPITHPSVDQAGGVIKGKKVRKNSVEPKSLIDINAKATVVFHTQVGIDENSLKSATTSLENRKTVPVKDEAYDMFMNFWDIPLPSEDVIIHSSGGVTEVPPVVIHMPAQASVLPTKRGMIYQETAGADKLELRKQLANEYLSYAGYMGGGARLMKADEDGNFSADLENGNLISIKNGKLDILSPQAKTYNSLPMTPEEKGILLNIAKEFLDKGFKVDDIGHFYHPETGTVLNLVYDNKKREVNICIMGIGSGDAINDISKTAKLGLLMSAIKGTLSNAVIGPVPLAIKQAIEIGEMLKMHVKDSDLKPVMVGHSHGGALAQAAAISNNLKGVVFNSAPLGHMAKKTIDKQIGKENRQINTQQIVAFSVGDDWLTDGSINGICRLGRDHGLPVASVMGKGYKLPTVEGNAGDKHCRFYKAFQSFVENPSN